LVETLRKQNSLDNTLIIITSDHGEAFGKLRHYDRGHSALLYNTVIKVPLIFYNSGLPVKGMSINNHVTSMDILPTILDVMGIQYNQQRFDGISQRELFEKSKFPDTSTRLIVSETNFKNMQKGMMRSCALWGQRWKLIYNHVRTFLNYNGKFPLYELYDLKNDPNELNNIFDKKRDMAEQIISLFQDWQKKNTIKLQNDTTQEKFSMENIDPAITNQLKALGYID
jgi:arylsulfatase A-like enzyme